MFGLIMLAIVVYLFISLFYAISRIYFAIQQNDYICNLPKKDKFKPLPVVTKINYVFLPSYFILRAAGYRR